MSIQTEITKPFTTVRQEIRLPARSSRQEHWSKVVLGLILFSELCLLLLRARGKPFWYDELVTAHLAGLEPLSRLRYALSNGADSMSLGYYLIVRLARMMPVDPLIAMRAPSILGYLAGLLGVYWFITKKMPATAGVVAVLLMTFSAYRWYATEARAYALTVGLLALSAALWQRVSERRFMTALFGGALFLAVGVYSLAVLAILCFAAAEFALVLREKRYRRGVWLAFAIATIPFFGTFRSLERLRTLYAAHFWAHTPWSALITAPGESLDLGQRMTPVLVIFSLIAMAWLMKKALESRRTRADEFELSELVLMGAFLIYPAFLIVFMKLQGAGYAPRYGLPGILGLIPAMVYICRNYCSERVFRWITAALLATFALQATYDLNAGRTSAMRASGERWAALARVARERPELPIVIASSHEFFDESEYGPVDLTARTVNLADKDISDRLLGSDSADVEDLILARFSLLHFEQAAPYLNQRPKFVLQSGETEDWLTSYLLEKRYRLSLIANDPAGPIYLAEK